MDPLLTKLVETYPELDVCLGDIEAAAELLKDSYRAGGKLLLCGNGGSAADCEHIVGELMKGFESKRPLPEDVRRKLLAASPEHGAYLADRLQGALPAVSLVGQTALATAFANDVAADLTFAQQVLGYGKPGDVLLGISTSGHSRSVLLALHAARALGLKTIGLAGRTGGAFVSACDVVIRVPRDRTREVQERHLPIYHALCLMLEEEFFG
ncbi:SIS domain-containing protein [Paenibacillus sp.]|uniref:D-sedoheptulose-7-phosphate isomerase n=1 Tax=Paenibacillus sp. TaxID=58172 RepID=UPI002D26B3BC|nr:SIS domain-containing protein [Paenibacillus sp.]HZG87082.1 SIS domain-containing protein [Paenibacillus sp.]